MAVTPKLGLNKEGPFQMSLYSCNKILTQMIDDASHLVHKDHKDPSKDCNQSVLSDTSHRLEVEVILRK